MLPALDGETITARHLVVATGVRDELPVVPDVVERILQVGWPREPTPTSSWSGWTSATH